MMNNANNIWPLGLSKDHYISSGVWCALDKSMYYNYDQANNLYKSSEEVTFPGYFDDSIRLITLPINQKQKRAGFTNFNNLLIQYFEYVYLWDFTAKRWISKQKPELISKISTFRKNAIKGVKQNWTKFNTRRTGIPQPEPAYGGTKRKNVYRKRNNNKYTKKNMKKYTNKSAKYPKIVKKTRKTRKNRK